MAGMGHSPRALDQGLHPGRIFDNLTHNLTSKHTSRAEVVLVLPWDRERVLRLSAGHCWMGVSHPPQRLLRRWRLPLRHNTSPTSLGHRTRSQTRHMSALLRLSNSHSSVAVHNRCTSSLRILSR